MRRPRPADSPGRHRVAWAWGRAMLGGGILAGLLLWLGAAPFLTALRRIDVAPVALAVAIAVPTTVCCAWRWRLVSVALGCDLPVRAATAAYYRSLFLNSVLPGGVLGDVHRAARRGRETGHLGRAARAVVSERVAGQLVQLGMTAVVLLALPSPVPRPVLVVVLALLGVVLVGVLVRARPSGRRVLPGVVLASAAVVAGHAATFLIAARTAGVTAPLAQLLPLALLVLLVSAVPASVAGWGPREGGAAWVFAIAGLGATEGVTVAVTYGVLVIAATLPGAALLLAFPRRAQVRVREVAVRG